MCIFGCGIFPSLPPSLVYFLLGLLPFHLHLDKFILRIVTNHSVTKRRMILVVTFVKDRKYISVLWFLQ